MLPLRTRTLTPLLGADPEQSKPLMTWKLNLKDSGTIGKAMLERTRKRCTL